MEWFFTIGAGLLVGAVSMALAFEIPAGLYLFAPMAIGGAACIVLGAVQAVPWFRRKLPDL
jgi:xanthosine utilization system XapX-like protein